MDLIESKLFARTPEPVEHNRCFVLMPFDPQYLEIYEDVIKPLLTELGFNCIRADELYGSRAIIQDIWRSIQTAGLIISDMTDKNPNVFYELGLAHAIGKNVILITQSIDDVPFDLRHLRCIVYEHNLRGAIKLKEQLRKTITNDPHIYSQIPVDILTDKFIGGFSSKTVDFMIEFTGHRGKIAKFTEKYSIIAEHDNLHQFYKKLQCSGHIISAEAENAAVEIKQLFIGMYLLSIILPTSLSIGGKHDFTVNYKLEDNFPDENEFWFYNAEVSIGKLRTQFIFPRKTAVRDFAVYKKSDREETITKSQPSNVVETDKTIFRWSINDITAPDCYVFRWRWR